MEENTLDKMSTEYLVQIIDTQKQLIESQSSQIEQIQRIESYARRVSAGKLKPTYGEIYGSLD